VHRPARVVGAGQCEGQVSSKIEDKVRFFAFIERADIAKPLQGWVN
jgi:hypothetical protein